MELDLQREMGDFPPMKQVSEIRIGSRCRAYLNGFAREGERYQVDKPGPDEIRLRRMVVKETKAPKARIVVVNGVKYLTNGRTMTQADTEAALADFP